MCYLRWGWKESNAGDVATRIEGEDGHSFDALLSLIFSSIVWLISSYMAVE